MSTTKLTVFDPSMCCSTGVCGPDVDPALAQFSSDLEWLEAEGVEVERYNLAQEPGEFVGDGDAKAFLETEGESELPLLKVDGEIVDYGEYPSRTTLADWVELSDESAPILTERVEELVAIGAAIASNCEKCFKYHYNQARQAGASPEQMRRAVELADGVKQTPANDIRELADRMLETSDSEQSDANESGGCCSGSDEPEADDSSSDESSSSGCC